MKKCGGGSSSTRWFGSPVPVVTLGSMSAGLCFSYTDSLLFLHFFLAHDPVFFFRSCFCFLRDFRFLISFRFGDLDLCFFRLMTLRFWFCNLFFQRHLSQIPDGLLVIAALHTQHFTALVIRLIHFIAFVFSYC